MTVGRELIIDLEEVDNIELLRDLENLYPLARSLVKNLNLTVIDSITHQFKDRENKNNNDGFTGLYLLSESHLSFHSFVKERCISINLYTCNSSTDFDEAIRIIYSYYNKPYVIKQILNR